MADLLERFKAAEDQTKERVYVVCENRRALKVLAAWSPAVVRIAGKVPTSGDDNTVWERLWQAATVSYDDLATMTTLSAEVAKEEVARLRMLRLVYPDGTVHKWAMDAVRRKLFEALGVKPKKAKD